MHQPQGQGPRDPSGPAPAAGRLESLVGKGLHARRPPSRSAFGRVRSSPQGGGGGDSASKCVNAVGLRGRRLAPGRRERVRGCRRLRSTVDSPSPSPFGLASRLPPRSSSPRKRGEVKRGARLSRLCPSWRGHAPDRWRDPPRRSQSPPLPRQIEFRSRPSFVMARPSFHTPSRLRAPEHAPLRRACRHDQFLLPARRLASAGDVAQAAALGLAAIGIADRNTMAGVVRAYSEWKNHQGHSQAPRRRAARHDRWFRSDRLSDRPRGLWPAVPAAQHRQPARQEGRVPCSASRKSSPPREGQIFIAMPPPRLEPELHRAACRGSCTPRLIANLSRRPCIAIAPTSRAGSAGSPSSPSARTRRSSPSTTCSITRPERRPLAGRAHLHPREMHHRARPACGSEANAERHLKTRRGDGAAVRQAIPTRSRARSRSPNACSFDLDELRYEYPDEPVPPGKTAAAASRGLAWARRRLALSERRPGRRSSDCSHEELALIAKLDYARYFLTVHDVVALRPQSKGILCQGRGSAANSAVCYCLGITAVDPTKIDSCCSPASSRPTAASRPTSTSTSSTSGARR